MKQRMTGAIRAMTVLALCGVLISDQSLAGSQGTPPPGQAVQPGDPPRPPASERTDSYIIEELVTRYEFQQDGSGLRSLGARVRVKDEAGVSIWGTLAITYMAATEDVKIRQLTVEKPDGRRITATDAPVEDVTMTGQLDEPAFSDWRAKRIAVPALQAGDRLIYDFMIRRSASLIPGHFWVDHSFTRDAVVLNETLAIETPASRVFKVSVQKGTEGREEEPAPGRRLRSWKHQQLEPETLPSDDSERLRALLEEVKRAPDIRASSFENWEQLGAWFAGIMDKQSEPDTSIRARALELTRNVESPEGRLGALFEFVSSQIRYISLAFGTGRFEPRPAAQILATQYGDCKDKHVLLASLARTVGLDIKPVLISTAADLDDQIPTPSQFDHLVTVEMRGEAAADWRWMDSTSGALPLGALFLNLRGKQALLVATKAVANTNPIARSAIVTTPSVLSIPSKIAIQIEGKIGESGGLTTRVTRRATGDAEFVLRLASREASQQDRLNMAQTQVRADGLRDATITDVQIKDLGPGRGIELMYKATHSFPLTVDKPWTIWIPAPSMALPAWPKNAATTPLDLGPPGEVVLVARYEVPVSVRARSPVAVSLEREFASYRSTYRAEHQLLVVERQLRTLSKEVSPAQAAAYDALRRAIDADYRQTFAAEAIARTAVPPATNADDLNTEGKEAHDRRDYKLAIDLLKRATKADPKHKYAWNNLGLAYIAARDFTAAVEVLERQIEINPFDQYAYTNLGRALWGLKKTDEALAQFKKQIEISPLDKWAHAYLGRLFAQLKRYEDAVTSFERAVSVTPDDADLWVSLGRARLAISQVAPALDAFGRAVDLSSEPDIRNNAAWALAEKEVHLDVAERYAAAAVDGIVKTLRDVKLDAVKAEDLWAVSSLAAFWDTLGWVHFKRGEMEKAESFLRASWLLAQESEVAEHLGRVYERLVKPDRAIHFYAQGVAVDRREANRLALERLVGPDKAEARVKAAVSEIVMDRTVKLKSTVTGTARADLYLLVESDGTIAAVHFVKGDDRLRKPLSGLVGTRTRFTAPPGQRLQVLRQAIVGCGKDAGCALVLLRPADVTPPSDQ